MGQCVSCARSSSSPADDTSPHFTGFHRPTEGSESDSSVSMAEGCRTVSATPQPDAHSNGSSKNSSIMVNVIEKRSFYSRIPPLTKSASSEVKRISSKDYYSEAKIHSLFDHYKAPDSDEILSEGIQRFCADLDVLPDDFRVLLFAWKCGAETMCKFTRQEFLTGCKAMRVDSVKAINQKFPELKNEVLDNEKFKSLYKFTFKFGLDADLGQRILPIETAVLLWRLVFVQRTPVILERWLLFLESHYHIRGIPRDTWNMFLNFCEAVGDDLSSYDDTDAWPSVFDDFVEYENDQLNQNISKDHHKDD